MMCEYRYSTKITGLNESMEFFFLKFLEVVLFALLQLEIQQMKENVRVNKRWLLSFARDMSNHDWTINLNERNTKMGQRVSKF